jgi:hypothetical protein
MDSGAKSTIIGFRKTGATCYLTVLTAVYYFFNLLFKDHARTPSLVTLERPPHVEHASECYSRTIDLVTRASIVDIFRLKTRIGLNMYVCNSRGVDFFQFSNLKHLRHTK